MIRRPPRSTRTDTLFPYTTLFRSLSTLILESNIPGGHLISIEKIEDFPGFPEGVAGYDLCPTVQRQAADQGRSEEHTSELQSLMRISYAVFCLKKKKKSTIKQNNTQVTTHITPHTDDHIHKR